MKKRSGLTIVELLISLSILAVILTIIFNVFISSSRFSSQELQRINVGENAVRSFSTVDSYLRQGKAVVGTFSTYTTGGTTLILSLPALLAGGALDPIKTDTGVLYFDQGSHQLKLLLAPDAASTRPAGTSTLAESIRDVYFRYNSDTPTNATVITVTIIASQTVGNRTFQQTNILQETIRNHP